MSVKGPAKRVAAPLFAFDKRARRAIAPYRNTPGAKVLSWASQAGDQLQLRLLCGGVLLLSAARRDTRLAHAALRMALAHELATFAKARTKDRVIRRRPRSADGSRVRPRKGHDTAKEESSFPSGHAGGAFAVAGAFTAEYPGHAGTAISAASALSGARLARNAHYPTDVVAGALIGSLAAAVVSGVWWLAARGIAARRSA